MDSVQHNSGKTMTDELLYIMMVLVYNIKLERSSKNPGVNTRSV